MEEKQKFPSISPTLKEPDPDAFVGLFYKTYKYNI